MMQQNLQDPITILVIAAHPDDIEFGVAGSVARWIDEGHRVVYCLITDGAAGSNEPDADLIALAAARRAEQQAAAAMLGVRAVHFLGYPDGVLQPDLKLRRDLTRLIRIIRPQRIVCQDPSTFFVGSSYINHPDHRAAGEAAIYALFPSSETRPIFPELLDEGLEPHRVHELYLTLTLHPDTYVDISPFIEQKIAALLCHRSQVTAQDGEWVRQWDAEYGVKAGTPFAEGFRVLHFGGNEPATETGSA